MTGLVASVLGGVLALAMAIIGGAAYQRMHEAVGGTDVPVIPPPGLEDHEAWMTWDLAFFGHLMSYLPLAAGLVLGIIAIALNRGRVYGIVATSLAVAGPILAFFVYMGVTWTAL